MDMFGYSGFLDDNEYEYKGIDETMDVVFNVDLVFDWKGGKIDWWLPNDPGNDMVETLNNDKLVDVGNDE